MSQSWALLAAIRARTTSMWKATCGSMEAPASSTASEVHAGSAVVRAGSHPASVRSSGCSFASSSVSVLAVVSSIGSWLAHATSLGQTQGYKGNGQSFHGVLAFVWMVRRGIAIWLGTSMDPLCDFPIRSTLATHASVLSQHANRTQRSSHAVLGQRARRVDHRHASGQLYWQIPIWSYCRYVQLSSHDATHAGSGSRTGAPPPYGCA